MSGNLWVKLSLGLWFACFCLAGELEANDAAGKLTRLNNPLALRLSNYGEYEAAGWTHLPTLGIHYVFLDAPPAAQIPALQQRLSTHGLRPLVLRGQTDLGRDTWAAELEAQLAVCRELGVRHLFFSPKHTGLDKPAAYQRLRVAGELARKHDVIIVLETHPDLGTNAQAHRETMREVNPPHVRVNLDTGNITFYNQGTDAVRELEQIIDYVATVELKDHSGRYMEWNFPPLGKGVVDFPAILKLLEKHRFPGPITIEVEGVKGVKMDENQTKQYIAESVKYIQSLGNFQ